MKNKKRTKKYATGTGKQGIVRNYIEDPSIALFENQIDKTQADSKMLNNPWTRGLDFLGNAGIQVGGMINPKAALPGSLIKGANGTFGLGGTTNKSRVEVEGEEVAEDPKGNLMEFKGPKHERGGIDVMLPDGTDIYSDRIKVDDVTMAERKKIREKKEAKLRKLLSKNPYDTLDRNTLKRTQKVNEIQEETDKKTQEVIGKMLKKEEEQEYAQIKGANGTFGSERTKKYATGTGKRGTTNKSSGGPVFGTLPLPLTPTIDELTNDFSLFPQINPLVTPGKDLFEEFELISPLTPEPVLDFGGKSEEDMIANALAQYEESLKKKQSKLLKILAAGAKGVTAGDAVGLGGDLLSTFGPMRNTKRNRAGDTPNINYYRDFGKDGLDVLDESKTYIAGQRDNALMDLEKNRASLTSRNRNSARGANTMRALDLASASQSNDAVKQLYDAFSRQMMGILGQESQLETGQDSMVMQGEEKRDLGDRQDRDSYYKALARDLATKGQGLQETGKSLNKMYLNKDNDKLLKMLIESGIDANTAQVFLEMMYGAEPVNNKKNKK
jgi:hypothetical protein